MRKFVIAAVAAASLLTAASAANAQLIRTPNGLVTINVPYVPNCPLGIYFYDYFGVLWCY